MVTNLLVERVVADTAAAAPWQASERSDQRRELCRQHRTVARFEGLDAHTAQVQAELCRGAVGRKGSGDLQSVALQRRQVACDTQTNKRQPHSQKILRGSRIQLASYTGYTLYSAVYNTVCTQYSVQYWPHRQLRLC
jgi:hypothetical protein